MGELFELLEAHAPRLIAEKFQSNDGTPARVLRLSIETMLEELAPNLLEKSLDSLGERDRILNMLKQCQVPRYSPLVDYDFIDHAISERTKQAMGLWTELVGNKENVNKSVEMLNTDPSLMYA